MANACAAPDYVALDAAIITAIGQGVRHMSALAAWVQEKEAAHCVNAKTSSFRTVYTRLQVLRRAGKVVYLRSGWHIVAQKLSTILPDKLGASATATKKP
jgi:hypothetical protein